MSWRTVIISQRAKLDLQLGSMVVRSEETKKIHLSEIGILIIESTAVSLTVALLSALVKEKVKIIFCDERRNPESELLPYCGCHDGTAKIRQQLVWSDDVRGSVWTEIVREKINRQAHLLRRLGLEQAKLLEEYLENMEFRDATNREGHAAKVYFNALFGLDFSRQEENSINAALNYGYGILLSAVNREIAACGYLNQLGLFHDNQFNAFNLGCDLMEPFRPLVDSLVWELKPNRFEREEKLKVLGFLEKQVRIDDTLQYVPAAIRMYCRSVFNALNEGDAAQLRFYAP